MSRPLALIGDEIQFDGVLVAVIHPDASRGSVLGEFRDWLHANPYPDDEADLEQKLEDAATEATHMALKSVETAIGELPLVGGLVSMTALLSALKGLKDNS